MVLQQQPLAVPSPGFCLLNTCFVRAWLLTGPLIPSGQSRLTDPPALIYHRDRPPRRQRQQPLLWAYYGTKFKPWAWRCTDAGRFFRFPLGLYIFSTIMRKRRKKKGGGGIKKKRQTMWQAQGYFILLKIMNFF